MKALTIQQPYAHLIALPDDHPNAKRVENRGWVTSHVGPVAIHAGKGLDYLQPGDRTRWPGMAFGCIVAVANLAGCVRLESSGDVPPWACRRWPWLAAHQHVEGPICWVLTGVRALRLPVPCRGGRQLWDVPVEVVEAVRRQAAKRT